MRRPASHEEWRERAVPVDEQELLCLLWRDYHVTPDQAEQLPDWQIRMAVADHNRRVDAEKGR